MAAITRGMGSLANRFLRLLDVRAVRSSTYDLLQQERESAGRLRDQLQANERERQHLQHLLEDARTNGQKVSELFSWLHGRVERSLLVPVDHPQVVQRRPGNHCFEEVRRCFERNASHIEGFLHDVLPFMYGPHLEVVPHEKATETDPFWNNGYFSGDDARMAYAVAARYRPATILEVGSGNSTKFFRKAIRDHQLSTRLLSIDPVPRAEITSVADQIVFKSVLDVPTSFFQVLKPGDVFFIDGSHLVFNGTDVVYLFLEVLPTLPAGVFVHVHDILLPEEYDEVFSDRQYNEQYLLAMLLLYSDRWVTLGPVKYLERQGRVRFGGVSFWMKCLAE